MVSAATRRGEQPARITPSQVVVLVVIALFGALLVFVWSVQRSPLAGTEPAQDRDEWRRDPDLGWANAARRMLVDGEDRNLARSADNRMHRWGYDAEAWLFAAFAYEAMAQRPGLWAMGARSHADDVWEELLLRTEPWREYAGRDGVVDWEALADSGKVPRGQFSNAYFAGWALLGLGHPLEASERFGRHLADAATQANMARIPYNRPCYLALAGDREGAIAAWLRPVTWRGANLEWATADPDLESFHGTPLLDWLPGLVEVLRDSTPDTDESPEPETGPDGDLRGL
ncbi:MAG: hypothetical protein H6810_02135 [Phycisphaeraceae bacterium]|nr:MAG: hypothetical protein H6810_02135 [Phycisphaeraceae bacterium]